jgi:hypothetical protein
MSMNRARVALGLIVTATLLTTGCKPVPDLTPRISQEAPPRSMVSESTIIVAGSVTSLDSRKSRVSEDQRLELVDVGVKVDAVFKGSVSSRNLNFYRYDCAANCRADYARAMLHTGQRYVFMLVREGDHLRSVQDLSASHFAIAQAADLSMISTEEAAHAVARAVLQSGNSNDATELANTLFVRRAIANNLIGRAQTIQLLKPLLSSPSLELRREACFALAEAMYDYDGCLSRLVADSAVSEALKNRARRRLTALTTLQGQLHSTFLTNPARWLDATAGKEDPRAIDDLLRMLNDHPDREVREQAARMIIRRKGEALF